MLSRLLLLRQIKRLRVPLLPVGELDPSGNWVGGRLGESVGEEGVGSGGSFHEGSGMSHDMIGDGQFSRQR